MIKIKNRLFISRPAVIIWYNFGRLEIFGCGPRCRSLVFLLFEDIQMGENLLYHRLLIYETDDAHFTSALGQVSGSTSHTFLMHSRHISCGIRFGLYFRISMILPSWATSPCSFPPSLSCCFFLSPRILLEYQPYIRVN